MKIEWHKESAGPMDWDEAVKYCKDMGDGWRLPNIQELVSIVDYDKDHMDSDLDMKTAYYWSSNEYANIPQLAWHVFFPVGLVGHFSKSYKNYVRAIRDMPGKDEGEQK